MSQQILELKQHDTKPWLVVQLRDLVGTPEEKPLNLTEEEIKKVSLVMRKKNAEATDEPKLKGVMQMTDKAEGVCTYKWITGDTSEAGEFEGEFEMEDEEGGIESVPRGVEGNIIIKINPDLG